MSDEREALIVGNLRLVRWYAKHRLPRWLHRLAGGVSQLVADLYPAYVQAVDKWMASDKTVRLSTYICKAMHWRGLRLARSYPVIYVPEARVPIKVDYFGGTEGECEDRALVIEDRAPADEADGIERVLNTLTSREREIIRLRYGLGRGPLHGYAHTLLEVGRTFGLTTSRVRQIEAKAIQKLQRPPRASELRRLFPQGSD